MSREEIQKSAKGWIQQANADIRHKMMDLMHKYHVMPRQLANAIGENEIDLNGILDGTRDVSLEMFVKILIATGNVLEIKPFNADEVPPCFERPRRRGFYDIPTPTSSIFDDIQLRPRRPENPFERRPQEEPRRQQSPFDTMTRDRLVGIINDRLWDTEIDTNRVTREELVEFLKKKDKLIKARANRQEEGVPQDDVKDLKDRIAETLKKKPYLRDFFEDILQ